MKNWLLVAAVLGGLGCGRAKPDAAVTPAAGPASDTTDLATLRARALALIGEPRCENESQCRLIAFGSKPCGGPRQYLVYSVATTDSVQLAAAVLRYNARDAELNRLQGRISDCMMVTPPRLRVVNGRCEAVSGGP
jgi:hypothetical protein